MALPFFYVGESHRRIYDRIRALNPLTGLYEYYQIPDTATLKFEAATRNGSKTISANASPITPQTDPNVMGGIEYYLTAADLDTPGKFRAGWLVTLQDGTKDYIPFKDGMTVLART